MSAVVTATADVLPFEPRRGRVWVGGVYVDRIGDYGLIAGPCLDGPVDWPTAIDWAPRVRAFGADDFSLPTLEELVALARTFPKFFRGGIWWSSEECSALPSDARVCAFDLGPEPENFLGHWGKRFHARAICVRRIAIEAVA